MSIGVTQDVIVHSNHHKENVFKSSIIERLPNCVFDIRHELFGNSMQVHVNSYSSLLLTFWSLHHWFLTVIPFVHYEHESVFNRVKL